MFQDLGETIELFAKDPGGRKPALLTCVVLYSALVCKSHRQTWTIAAIVDTREGLTRQERKRVYARLQNWISRRRERLGLPQTGNISRAELMEAAKAREHFARGKLFFELEQIVMTMCDKRSFGTPAEVLELGDPYDNPVRYLEEPASIDLKQLRMLVGELRQKQYASDYARLFRDHAGPGLKAVWEKHFGKPAAYLPRRKARRTAKAKADAPAERRQIQTRVSKSTRPFPVHKPKRAETDSKKRMPPKVKAPREPIQLSPAEANFGFLENNPVSPSGSVPIRHVPKLAKLTAVALLFCFLATSAFTYLNPDVRLFEIATKMGSREAIVYMKKWAEGKGDYYFYLLWYGHYRNGQIDESKVGLVKLAAETESYYVKSLCFLTLGDIERESGESEISIGNLIQAHRFLKEFGGHEPLSFLIDIALSKTYLEIEETTRAGDYLSKAKKLIRHASQNAVFSYWDTHGRLNLERGNYNAALDDFRMARKFATNADHRFNFHAWTAATLWAQGNAAAAVKHIDKADILVTNNRMRAHLNTVKIGVRHCFGLDYAELEAQVLDWTKKHPSESLSRKLARAKNCPTEQFF